MQQTMRRTEFTVPTSGGDVDVRLYRDQHQAYVLLTGPSAYALSDLLAQHVHSTYLSHFDPSCVCWLTRTITRSGTPIIRQVHFKEHQAEHPASTDEHPANSVKRPTNSVRYSKEALDTLLRQIDNEYT